MDWGTFLHMGGYAFYVWGTYALAAVILGINVWLPLRELRQQQKLLKQETETQT